MMTPKSWIFNIKDLKKQKARKIVTTAEMMKLWYRMTEIREKKY